MKVLLVWVALVVAGDDGRIRGDEPADLVVGEGVGSESGGDIIVDTDVIAAISDRVSPACSSSSDRRSPIDPLNSIDQANPLMKVPVACANRLRVERADEGYLCGYLT